MLLGILGLILCILLVPVTFLVITDKIKVQRLFVCGQNELIIIYYNSIHDHCYTCVRLLLFTTKKNCGFGPCWNYLNDY